MNSHKELMEARKIGGSDAAAVCWKNSYDRTAIDVYKDFICRLDGIPVEGVNNEYTRHGNKYEPVVREWYKTMLPRDWIVDNVGNLWTSNEKEFSDIVSCSPDGQIYHVSSPENIELHAIIEIKCPYGLSYNSPFRKKKGIYCDCPWIPDEHTFQMQWNMWVTHTKWCDYIVAKINPRNEQWESAFIVRHYFDAAFIDWMKPFVSYLSECIRTRQEPSSNFKKTQPEHPPKKSRGIILTSLYFMKPQYNRFVKGSYADPMLDFTYAMAKSPQCRNNKQPNNTNTNRPTTAINNNNNKNNPTRILGCKRGRPP